jgi:hypothetical protein
MRADPDVALRVDQGFHEHCVPGTTSSYGTGARDYVKFCTMRDLLPWPVDEITYCGWLHVTAARIKVKSMNMYMAGVRDASILQGHGWRMTGNEMVRRTMRFLRRKYPCKAKGSKVPVTVAVLFVILALLPGWPDMAAMSEDDRVFASASVTAVCGFLRGGEFLTYAKSTRPILKGTAMTIRHVGTHRALVVGVPQPKTHFELESESVPCFENTVDGAMCPIRLWEEYSTRCPDYKAQGPAFMLGGKPLTRDYMVQRTTQLMCLANIAFVDHRGDPMDVRAASWRSGAASSAVKAQMPVPHIMALGRWTSRAWENYILQSHVDLQGSANSMWAGTSLQLAPSTSGLKVAEFDAGGFFAPFLAQTINTDLSTLNIDINSPR